MVVCSVTSLFEGWAAPLYFLLASVGREGGNGGGERLRPHRDHPFCCSSSRHLVRHVLQDQEGQVVGDIQEKADSLITGQEGEQPSHQNLPFPHRQHLQEAICCLPTGERRAFLRAALGRTASGQQQVPMTAGPPLLRPRWDSHTHSRLFCSWVFKA